MPNLKILVTFILIDLLIVAGVIYCVFQGMPVGKYLPLAIVLFVLNGIGLVVMTIRKTPHS